MLKSCILILWLLALLTGCGAREHSAGSPDCSDRTLVVRSEYDDVFVVPVPADRCADGLVQPLSDEHIAALADSIYTQLNASDAAPEMMDSLAGGQEEIAACCRVTVRAPRVTVSAPSVTVRGTSVTAKAPEVTAKPPSVRVEGLPEVRIGGGSPPSGEAPSCSLMRDERYLPAGHHPVSAQWRPEDPNVDLVCIAKTEGTPIRFLAWRGIRIPAGYHILYQYPNPSPSFNGCAQWSQLGDGPRTCIAMYHLYELAKD